MNLKKITSLVMLWAMLIMTYTGIMLFIAPPGRVANWSDWLILGVTKEQYGSIHITFMILFITATILHIYYNWKPMTSYMKNKAKEMIVFTKEMIIATVVTFVFILGTLFEIPPFSSFLHLGESISDSWEKDYGTAPYSHAELSSLENFSKKLGFDIAKVEEILKSNNIKYDLKQSLSQIGKNNSVSPQFIYNLLKVHFTKSGAKIVEISGLGKKKVKDVAVTLGISPAQFIAKLKELNIEAKADDKFKTVVENHNMSPIDVMSKLGYKKPQ
jgi:hypothetical protein